MKERKIESKKEEKSRKTEPGNFVSYDDLHLNL
jgi:hypothetical protein